jgi:hypothetical protein
MAPVPLTMGAPDADSQGAHYSSWVIIAPDGQATTIVPIDRHAFDSNAVMGVMRCAREAHPSPA